MNAWVAVMIRYGAGVLRLDEKRIESIDIKTRRLMTMNRSLHPRGNVGRLYLPRKEGGRGFISCKECVNMEMQSLDKYLSESEEWILKFVAGEKGLSEVKDLETFKKHLKEERTSQWLENKSPR